MKPESALAYASGRRATLRCRRYLASHHTPGQRSPIKAATIPPSPRPRKATASRVYRNAGPFRRRQTRPQELRSEPGSQFPCVRAASRLPKSFLQWHFFGMLASCAPAPPNSGIARPDPAFDITYVAGRPAAAVDGEFAIFCFDVELGWGFNDRAKQWHAAPQNHRAALEYYHPHGRGLACYERPNGGQIAATPSSGERSSGSSRPPQYSSETEASTPGLAIPPPIPYGLPEIGIGGHYRRGLRGEPGSSSGQPAALSRQIPEQRGGSSEAIGLNRLDIAQSPEDTGLHHDTAAVPRDTGLHHRDTAAVPGDPGLNHREADPNQAAETTGADDAVRTADGLTPGRR